LRRGSRYCPWVAGFEIDRWIGPAREPQSTAARFGIAGSAVTATVPARASAAIPSSP
jgi:hypothetical protein